MTAERTKTLIGGVSKSTLYRQVGQVTLASRSLPTGGARAAGGGAAAAAGLARGEAVGAVAGARPPLLIALGLFDEQAEKEKDKVSFGVCDPTIQDSDLEVPPVDTTAGNAAPSNLAILAALVASL